MTILLTLLAVLSGATHIWSEYQTPKRQRLIYFFKPLTMTCIIWLALFSESNISQTYKTLIVIGLFFSLGGDIFLMLPPRFFLPGLLSFLVAHLVYIGAFTIENNPKLTLPLLLVFLLFGGGVLALLWEHLGRLKIPVIIYIGAILTMGWQAISRWMNYHLEGSELAAIGAVLFMASDTALAFNRFRHPFRAAQLVILSTYFCAQWLIALSI